MKKIRIRHIILVALIFVQCSVDEDESNLDLIQGENVQNEDNKPSDSTNQSLSDSSNSVTQTSFEHQKMLINWADNIIIPSILNFESSLSELKEIASLFANNPSSDGLSDIREAWLQSFLKWQHIEMFDIGIAEEIYYKNRVNIYPANVDRIENNILNQDYDLNQSSNFSSQGFNGLDYLLFGIGENEDEIILKYSTENLNYGKYLTDLINKMIELTVEVKNGWNDEYREEFINSTDNTSTSSINKLINDFIYYFEKGYRTNKIGIPAGIWSNSTLPDRVEAYHGKTYSKTLALEATLAIDNFFNGRHSNDIESSGLSIGEYLNYIESDQDEKLAAKINEQLEKIKVKLGELNNDFSEQVSQDNNSMLTTFDVIQVNVYLLKVDMLQKLNISIDYVDADGD
jgi:predicted lipoprotein